MDQTGASEGTALARAPRAGVFVDRATRQWVVRDPEGRFWILPPGDDPWRHRRPFQPTEETGLDVVPGHYKHVLGLPF